jgi:hypothetical protein
VCSSDLYGFDDHRQGVSSAIFAVDRDLSGLIRINQYQIMIHTAHIQNNAF